MNENHARPKLLGLTLTGSWRNCPVLQDAHDTGGIVLDDSGLCEKVGCQTAQLEAYLQENWLEHDLKQETDQVDRNDMSLVQQHQGYFILRLFSPVEPDSAIVRQLRKERVRPQVM